MDADMVYFATLLGAFFLNSFFLGFMVCHTINLWHEIKENRK